MVHGLAVQLKGDLRLSSQVGRGTRAELWLPASSGAVSRAPDETSDDGGLESEKIRVLVVDDDPLIASSTADMVADLGHSAIEADSGDRALDILQSDAEIELLLTDYLMPRMNGVELAKAAQRIRPRLATILATGYAEILGSQESSLARINKPYTQAQLAAEIAKALKARRALHKQFGKKAGD